MNVTPKLSFMKDETKVLGSGDWFVDNDDAGSFCYSGIWQGGKVIALVLDEHSDSEVVKERGNLFVKAVNTHDQLISALRNLEVSANSLQYCFDRRPENFGVALTQLAADAERARAALIAAGEPV